jgi:hypothetical protein
VDDEKADHTNEARQIREQAVHVVSTFEWNSKARIATF